MADELRRVALACAVAAFVLVGVVRWFAVRQDILDHPSDRSSHSVATPRGGGLGLLLSALGCWTWRAFAAEYWLLIIPMLGAALVALVGWLDDRRGLGVRTRLAVHVLAAAGVGVIAAADSSTPLLALALFVWWAFWTVSSINLVNFMDGINGLVASQIAVFALSLALFPDPTNAVAVLAIAVVGACIGFLPWNFPRARIFMGDVGSGGLGYLVPVLALLAMRGQGIDILRAHVPLLPLFGDATWTIFRRWRRGERLTAPHRSHLYQRLANGGMGHTRVTVVYTLAALGGAVVAHADSASGVPLWSLAYAALVVAAGALLDRHATMLARAAA